MSKCSKCQNDFIHLLKSDGLPYKHCDRCRRTEKKYRDKHKEQKKNTEKLIKNIQKNMVFIIENLIKISSPGRGRQHKYIHAKKTGGGCMGVQYRLAHRREESEDHK